MERIFNWSTAILERKRSSLFLLLAVIILLPVILFAAYNYIKLDRVFTENILQEKNKTAFLSATILNERLDRTVDLGISFASRIIFRQKISEGKWQEAIDLVSNIPKDFPLVERLFLVDPKGILMADFPALPDVRGKDFSFRDWYQGVSREWKPYVSEIYKRTAVPQYNVVAITVPIKDDSQKVIGILVMQINLETFVEWAKDINVGPDGGVFFVDHKGNLIGEYPGLSEKKDEVVNIADKPYVKKVLEGKYGWGAIVHQESAAAFANRASNRSNFFAVTVLIFLLNSLLAYFIARLIRSLDDMRRKEKTFLESIGDGVIGIDRGFVITLFNPAASRLTGFSALEAIGKPMQDIVKFINEKDRTENIKFIEEAMLFGKVKEMANHAVLITKTGTEIPVGDSAAPIFDADRNVTGAIVVFRDISREREVAKMKDDFVLLASHELRTPMTSIAGFVDMILEGRYGQISEDVKEPLGYIAESTDRLIRFVNDLLNVSRIEAGRMKFTLGEFDLEKIASKVVTELRPVAEKRKLELSVQTKGEVRVQADTEKVEQILHNLIGNSLKFTNKGKISVTIHKDRDTGVIEVIDTGVGIPGNEQNKLFGKFEQVNTDSAGRPAGTGLGLYISRQMARKMGGEVALVESVIGSGSKFSLSLPTLDSTSAGVAAKQIEAERANTIR